MQIAERMRRLGTESAFEVLARANGLAAQGRSIINLGIGQPDFSTPPNVVEAGRKAFADGHHGYTPANGIPELRAAVAADVAQRYAVEIDPDQVVCVPGSKVTMPTSSNTLLTCSISSVWAVSGSSPSSVRVGYTRAWRGSARRVRAL